MSKEEMKAEILDKISLEKYNCYFIQAKVRCLNREISQMYSEAMDEYAKQQAVEFHKWELFQWEINKDHPMTSSENLYSIFIQSQSETKPTDNDKY